MTKQELHDMRKIAHELLYSMVENDGKPNPKLVCKLVDQVECITYYVEAGIDMKRLSDK